MHIDRTNQVPVPGELAFAAHPISAFGLVCVPTCRTAARCSSFGAGEAHDMGCLAFVGEIVDVLAIFPQSHALIVVPAIVLVTDTMRIADEEGSDLLLNTTGDHLTGGLVPHIPNTPLGSTTLLVLGALQFLPVPGVFLAPGLLPGDLTQLLCPLPFERTDTTPGDDHSLACIRRDGCQMDLAQVNGRLDGTRSHLGLWYLYAYMQFKTLVPDQSTSTALFWEVEGQNQRWTPLAQRQHHAPTFFRDRLSRPFDRIEALGAPGVFHLHLWVSLAQLPGGLNVSKESTNHHLNRLAVQFKLSPFRGFLQRITSRPLCMRQACSLVDLHAHIPDLCRLHLGRFAALELFGRQVIQLVDFYHIHG